MANGKNLIWIFANCKASEIIAASSEHIAKIKEKGTVLSQVKATADFKKEAASAGTQGKTIWEVSKEENLVIGTLDEQFDVCVIDVDSCVALEFELAKIMEKIDRRSILCVQADGGAILYGSGIAKGKSIDKEVSAASVGVTLSYVVNLPMPEDCVAPVVFAVLKDINLRFKEVNKLYTTIDNMESAMERKSRQPWGKHDCA